MIDVERLYQRLPSVLQHAMVAVEGLRVSRRRFNGEFCQLLAAACARGTWNTERIAEFRDQRIAGFVRHAVASVPYYRQQFTRAKVDPREIRSLRDLAGVPILSRHAVREAPSLFRADGFVGETLQAHTSGSTGAGLRFPVTWMAHREQWAVWWRYRAWHGIDQRTPCLYFGGRSVVPSSQRRPPFWRHDPIGSRWLFSAYHLKADTARSYLEAAQRSGARWMHGYPSVVALMATYALELGVELPLRWVTLGAENLLPQQARVIEQAFGVRPSEHYGMAEGVANASMCVERRLHVDEDFAATEFVPDSEGRCRVIGTNFSNPAFPLLRYDVGDYAVPASNPCPCGRPGRILERIDGRLEDYVITRSGARLGRLDHIFKDMANVREAQIRQSRIGHMSIAVVPGAKWSQADEVELRAAIRQRIGDELDVEVEFVQAVSRTGAEKLRFVVSTLPSGRITSTK